MTAQALQPEVLDNIKSFSGSPGEMNALQAALSEGKGIQKVQTTYTTAVAVQRPRSITRVTANVLEEAKLAGASFYYGWTAKAKEGKSEKIEGPSIDLAMCIARNYGNCAIDIDDQETLTHYIFRGAFIDLETGFTCPRLFRQRKKQNIGMKDQDRAEDITYQIGQSKVIRNCIVRATPAWLVDQAIETAKTAELNKIKPENIAIARARSFDFFRQYGVTQERIEAKITRKMDDWTAQDIVDLRGMATALKEGRVTAVELFPEIEPPKTEDEGKKEAGNGKVKKEPTKKAEGAEKAPEPDPTPARFECPKGGFVTVEICGKCGDKNAECPKEALG